jgi:hypothetical protein
MACEQSLNEVGYETHLASSEDLLAWKSLGKILPFRMYYNGIVYHYYCAVGSQGRVIALATSRDVRASDTGK